ncbi:MAG: DedA family protein [Planctomycetota bacterium]
MPAGRAGWRVVTSRGPRENAIEALLDLFQNAPYAWIPVLMILCGAGLPLPEEIILVLTGYLAYANPDRHHAGLLYAVCVAAIVIGDLVPFLAGRIFGPRLLRIRIVRTWMSTERLARFDAFFLKHGRLTVLVARFLTGVRMPAFFTAGTMRMGLIKFMVMDGLGAMVGVAVFMWIGLKSGAHIDTAIAWVKHTERTFLALMVLGGLVLAWWWWAHRRKRRLLGAEVRETFVGPTGTDPDHERGGAQSPMTALGPPAPRDRIGPPPGGAQTLPLPPPAAAAAEVASAGDEDGDEPPQDPSEAAGGHEAGPPADDPGWLEPKGRGAARPTDS